MSKLISTKILMLGMLALVGCDSICGMMYVNFFFEESVTSKKLKEMEPGEYKNLKDIYNEPWQKVCVRFPYSMVIGDSSIKYKEPCFNKKQVGFV